MITISRTTSQDNLEELVEQIKTAQWLPASDIHPKDYSVESLSNFLTTNTTVFIVAKEKTEFAGMGSAHMLNNPSGDKWLFVDEIDVCSNKQRLGVGTALMKFFFEFAKKNGCQEVWVSTEVHNKAATGLYTSLSPKSIETFTGFTYGM